MLELFNAAFKDCGIVWEYLEQSSIQRKSLGCL